MTVNSRQAFASLGLATLVSALAGCPPNLTGEPCDTDCACPTSQTCVANPNPGSENSPRASCQDGVNTCDAGISPDAGPDGGQAAFAGTVVLNGGAAPSNGVEIYGYANGTPDLDGGNYVNADLTQLSSGGDFAFSGSVPPAAGSGYRFVAVYDSNTRGGDFDVTHTGVFWQDSMSMLAPGSDAGLSMHLDVQTSTCFTITSDLGQVGVTLLFAAGIVAYDIHTGGPLTQPSVFHSAFAVFDAGSPVPFIDAGSPFGQLTLVPVGTVPETEITNSWLYVPPGVTAISNVGSFLFSFTDDTSAKPEYPGGSCAVTYDPPPGFPSDLTLNGMDGGATWGGLASSARGKDIVAWQDVTSGLPEGFTYLGDLVTIDDGSSTQIYTAGTQPVPNLSPLSLPDSQVPAGSCDAFSKRHCTLNITSLYQDGRKPRSIPYEGGTTVLTFQRAAGG